MNLSHEQLGPGPTFRTAYRVYRGVVAATLRRNGVSEASLDDAIQDTFLVAYRRRDDFDGRGVQAWLRAIARRVAHNHRRTESRAARKHIALEFGSKRAPADADVHANVQVIEQFVASLSPTERELFVRSELEGQTSRELADSLQENPNTLYSRIRVLRQRLRQGLHSVLAVAAPGLKPAGLLGAAVLGLGATVFIVSRPNAPLQTVRALGDGSVMPLPGSGPTRTDAHVPQPTSSSPPDSATNRALKRPPAPAVPQQETAPVPPRRARSTSRQPQPQTRNTQLAEQSRRLLEADQALRRGEFVAALALLDQHAVDFPRSALAELREAIRIDVLSRSGKRQEACSLARDFLTRYANTTSSARVEKSCPDVHEDRRKRK